MADEDIKHLADLPYDENFTKAMTMGQTIVEYDNQYLTSLLMQTWETVKLLTSN